MQRRAVTISSLIISLLIVSTTALSLPISNENKKAEKRDIAITIKNVAFAYSYHWTQEANSSGQLLCYSGQTVKNIPTCNTAFAVDINKSIVVTTDTLNPTNQRQSYHVCTIPPEILRNLPKTGTTNLNITFTSRTQCEATF